MQTITISGALIEDAQVKTDKKGYNYIRFKVGCEDLDMSGKKTTTVYRCYSYNLEFSDLKKEDIIFLTGSLTLSLYKENVTLDVKVQNISRGFVMKEFKKQ